MTSLEKELRKSMYCRKCARFSRTLNQKNPICGACGYFGVIAIDFDLNQAKASVGRQEVIAMKRKRRCRDCNKVIKGLERYFHCHECRPQFMRPTEDRFDIFSAYERVSLMSPIAIQGVNYVK